MPQLQYIIVIDGFSVHDNPRTNYLVKELAVFNLEKNSATLYRFRVHRTFHRLPIQDQKTASYCLHKVHGMRFRDYRNDLHQKYVDILIRSIVDHCNFHHYTLGYKGGSLERTLFIKHGAQSILNIEDLGCPKYGKILTDSSLATLAHSYSRKILGTKGTTCLRHVGPRNSKQKFDFHCPLTEVCHFAAWLHCNTDM